MSIADKLTTVAENQQKVFDAGKSAEWNAFWDSLQDNGSRTAYAYAFMRWNKQCFKPKYNMTPSSCNQMFQNAFVDEPVSLIEALGELVLDTSSSTGFTNMFGYSGVTEVPIISTISASTIQQAFDNAADLVTIEKLVLKADGSQTFTNTFRKCTKLSNIVIEGVIGNTIDFSSCPLSKDSFTSVINALSSSTTGKTATFNQTAKEAAFTADEWSALIATKPNWTISLV